jgi:pyridoxamine-phosphate oxidase
VWRTDDPFGLAEVLGDARALQSRFEDLDAGDRKLLLLLAVVGTAIDVPTLALATARTARDLEQRRALLDARGLVWYSNYESRKGRELAHQPYAALQFHWVELERVVRIEGLVDKVSGEESDAYYATRPLDSRLGAWASPQSQPIASRAVLVANAAKAAARHGLNPPRPPHWGGYRLSPDRWEFWQGRRSRLHDRVRYLREADQWLRQRLAP